MIKEILKSRKAYEAKIIKLKNELFNTKFDFNNTVRALEDSLSFSKCELNRLQRALDRADQDSGYMAVQLDEIKQELMEAKAKYVNLVNKRYEE